VLPFESFTLLISYPPFVVSAPAPAPAAPAAPPASFLIFI